MRNRTTRFFSSHRIFIVVYLYQFSLQAFVRSIVPVCTAPNYPWRFRFHIFFLELWFLTKATYGLVFGRTTKHESFLDYTMVFPNYLEFFLLFIETFGIQEYRLQRERESFSLIDGGSGWGMSIVYFKHFYPDARILAVEANKKTAAYLRENIKRNRIRGVTIRTALVSGKNGTHAFYAYHGMDGWSVSDTGARDFTLTHRGFTKTTVPSVSLAGLLSRGAHVVKLDIEGMEGEAVDSARDALRMVSEVIIEHHHGMNRKRNAFSHICSILEEAGLSVRYTNTKSLIYKKYALRMIHAVRP